MVTLFYKSILFYLLTATLLSSKPASVAPHPLHVSTTDISYNAQDNQLEVIFTIFTDDFEAALAKQYHTKTDLLKPAMHTAMDALIKSYIASNVHIKSGAAALPFNYVGFEINREAVNVYIESSKTSVPKKIDAEVTLLHNLYTDQLNIVHMTVNGTRKSAKLDYPDKTVSQTF
jgi:hypothetical protein